MTLDQLGALIKDITPEQMAVFLQNGIALQAQASLRAKAARVRAEANDAKVAAEAAALDLEQQASALDDVVNK